MVEDKPIKECTEEELQEAVNRGIEALKELTIRKRLAASWFSGRKVE